MSMSMSMSALSPGQCQCLARHGGMHSPSPLSSPSSPCPPTSPSFPSLHALSRKPKPCVACISIGSTATATAPCSRRQQRRDALPNPISSVLPSSTSSSISVSSTSSSIMSSRGVSLPPSHQPQPQQQRRKLCCSMVHVEGAQKQHRQQRQQQRRPRCWQSGQGLRRSLLGAAPSTLPCLHDQCNNAPLVASSWCTRHSIRPRGTQASAHGPDAGTRSRNTQARSRRGDTGKGRGCRMIGTGSAVPSRLITNDDLARVVDTSDEWIATRTGIRSRRVLAEGESLTQLAVEACTRALASAGVAAEEVDLLLFCSSTPDDIFGGACLVQRDLGCTNAVAFDLTAACSGFVLGLVTASRFIMGGGFENVLVVGGDALSRFVDWSDRGTCILFGDACGAVVLRAAADDEADCLLGFDMRSDGSGAKHLNASVASCRVPGFGVASGHSSREHGHGSGNGHVLGHALNGAAHSGSGRDTPAMALPLTPPAPFQSPPPARTPPAPAAAAAGGAGSAEHAAAASPVAVALAVAESEREGEGQGGAQAEAEEGEWEWEAPGRAQPSVVAMNGREVYKFAVTAVPQVLEVAMEEAGVAASDLDWLLLHQANQRILDAVAHKMGLPLEKVLSNVACYGNTSAASIPLALDEAVRGGKVKKGDLLGIAGFGAGLTWAGAVVRYG